MNTLHIPSEKENKETLKDIQNGKFKEYYVIYNRKSTDEPENQKNSLHYQKTENLRFAEREQLPIANLSMLGFCRDGIISEKHSGYKENSEIEFGNDGSVKYRIERPKFFQLVQYLNKSYFKGVIFLCWDRASRNDNDSNIVKKLKQKVDLRFTYAKYDNSSSGALHMDIDGMFSAHYSRVTAEKVRLNIKDWKSRGIMPYKAGVGYLNLGKMEDKPFDPVRAPIVKRMFELAAEGWCLNDIAKWSIKQGFTMPPIRRRKTKEEKLQEEEDDVKIKIEPICRLPNANTIHQILRNRLYIGEILLSDGTYTKSVCHKPLVSKEVFYAAQEAFQKKRVSVHYSEKIKYPFRGLIRCADCNRLYTPYAKKGIQYYASRCLATCENSNKNFNFQFLKDLIGERLQQFVFSTEELNQIYLQANKKMVHFDAGLKNEVEALERRKRKVQEDYTFLQKNKLNLLQAGTYTATEYVRETETVMREMFALEEKKISSDVSMQTVWEETQTLSELLKSLYLTYEKAKAEQVELIVQNLFSELSISENTLKIKCKKGIDAFEDRFFVMGAPLTWLSEVATYRDDIIKRTQELREVLKKLEETSVN
ncbi:MAG: hypothetical protein POELPBGB_02940 [Bacteroidia bacterium]|nr:hypothetical protein [Bacteroidia bacterium]